jgi:hypothetical protein
MWCVDCKTAWDWRTEEVTKGVIHNPEYFRYMRERGLQIQQTPNQQHNRNVNYGCVNREILYNRFDHLFIDKIVYRNKEFENFKIGKYEVAYLTSFFDNLFRHLYNFRNEQGNRGGYNPLKDIGIYYREEHNFDTYKINRINYIMKNITEDEIKTKLIKGHREMEYKNMIFLLCETLTMVIEDTLRRIQEFVTITERPENNKLQQKDFPDDVFRELLHYMEYFNNESKKISELFGYRKHFEVTIDKQNNSIKVTQPKCIKLNKKESEEEESEEESEEEKYIPKLKRKD